MYAAIEDTTGRPVFVVVGARTDLLESVLSAYIGRLYWTGKSYDLDMAAIPAQCPRFGFSVEPFQPYVLQVTWKDISPFGVRQYVLIPVEHEPDNIKPVFLNKLGETIFRARLAERKTDPQAIAYDLWRAGRWPLSEPCHYSEETTQDYRLSILGCVTGEPSDA